MGDLDPGVRDVRAIIRRAAKVTVRRALLAGLFRVRRFSWASNPSRESATVLMCLWNRPDRIAAILRQLDEQEYPTGVRLYLWNNRRSHHARYLAALSEFEPRGALREVSIVKSPYNIGSIARFYWARKLAKTRGPAPIIVLDDDQDVDARFVGVAMSAARERTLTAWWSWTVDGAYWNRREAGVGDRVDHIGPGGMVADGSLFLDTRFFTQIPDRWGLLDDIWLSWFARQSGYHLRHLNVEIRFVMHETNQFHGQIDVKSEFYDYLARRSTGAS